MKIRMTFSEQLTSSKEQRSIQLLKLDLRLETP